MMLEYKTTLINYRSYFEDLIIMMKTAMHKESKIDRR